MIHHDFIEKPEPELSDTERIARINERIKGIEFDIACLQRVRNGWFKNGNAIRDLKAALKDYEQRRDSLALKG